MSVRASLVNPPPSITARIEYQSEAVTALVSHCANSALFTELVPLFTTSTPRLDQPLVALTPRAHSTRNGCAVEPPAVPRIATMAPGLSSVATFGLDGIAG